MLTAARPRPTVITRDPDDNRVLAAAINSRAALIATGDDDLLDLRVYRKIEVVAPRAAVERLGI